MVKFIVLKSIVVHLLKLKALGSNPAAAITLQLDEDSHQHYRMHVPLLRSWFQRVRLVLGAVMMILKSFYQFFLETSNILSCELIQILLLPKRRLEAFLGLLGVQP